MTPEEAAQHRPRVVLIDENNNPKEVIDLSVASPNMVLPKEFLDEPMLV